MTQSPYAICPLTSVALYHKPGGGAVQTSELLFGELVEIIEQSGPQWVLVRSPQDGFEAWALGRQLLPVSAVEYDILRTQAAFALDLFQPVVTSTHLIPVVLGSRLPNYDGMQLRLGQHRFSYSGQALRPGDVELTAERLIKIARKLLYAPFRLGGRTPLGIDGANLLRLVYSIAGYSLPRHASAQVMAGRSVDFMVQSQAGDLAYFDDLKREITHCGLLLPGGLILHVHEHVRIDAIDHFGIFNLDSGRYTHRLRIVKRLLPDQEVPGRLIPPVREEGLASRNQLAIF